MAVRTVSAFLHDRASGPSFTAVGPIYRWCRSARRLPPATHTRSSNTQYASYSTYIITSLALRICPQESANGSIVGARAIGSEMKSLHVRAFLQLQRLLFGGINPAARLRREPRRSVLLLIGTVLVVLGAASAYT